MVCSYGLIIIYKMLQVDGCQYFRCVFVQDTTALVDRPSALLAAIYESKTSSTMNLSSGTRAQLSMEVQRPLNKWSFGKDHCFSRGS